MLDDIELDKMEQIACESDPRSQMADYVCKLVSEVRRLRHYFNDPNYKYSGGDIHRQAIVTRNAEIDRLNKQLKDLEASNALLVSVPTS